MKTRYVIVPHPIDDFSSPALSGYRRARIVAFTTADPRLGRFILDARVHSKRAQRSSGHPQGYIEFENRERFDISSQSISGTRVYLFHYEEAHEFIELARLRENLACLIRTANDELFFVLADLIFEQLNMRITQRVRAWLQPGLLSDSLPRLDQETMIRLIELVWASPNGFFSSWLG